MLSQGLKEPGGIRDFATALLFAVVLVLPPLVGWAQESTGDTLVNERRPVTPLPKLCGGWSSIRMFPVRFADHYADTIGLRTPLLRLRARLMWFGFGVSPSPTLIRGKRDWVFLTTSKSLDVYRGLDPFTEEELEEWRRKLEERRDVLEAMGVKYIRAVAPNKNQIYPNYLPDELSQVGPTRLDQLIGYLEDHSDFQILDLRQRLHAERAMDEGDRWTYYRLGTHWTNRGAFAVHERIVEAMADLFEDRFTALRPFSASSCRQALQDKQADSWADRMYLEDLLFQDVYSHNPSREHSRVRTLTVESKRPRRTVTETGDTELPTVTMFHDSFGMQLRPFMAEVTRTLTAFRDIAFTVSEDAVKQADLVLELQVERSLVTQKPQFDCQWSQGGLEQLFRSSKEVLFKLSPEESQAFSVSRKLAIGVDRAPFGQQGFTTPAPEAGRVLLGSLNYPIDRTVIVAVDVESTKEAWVRLQWQTHRERSYNLRRTHSAAAGPGRSTVFFHLHAPDLEGPLRLDLGADAESYSLFRLEVRALDR